MLGHSFGCSVCDFDWGTGWSHHAAGQFLICRSCGTSLLAGGGTSYWGPQRGERLQLFCDLDDAWQASGVFITVPTGGALLPDMVQQGITCPHCHSAAAVTHSLQVGEPCPRCNLGIIQETGVCIY